MKKLVKITIFEHQQNGDPKWTFFFSRQVRVRVRVRVRVGVGVRVRVTLRPSSPLRTTLITNRPTDQTNCTG